MRTVLRQMKTRKSPGKDGVTCEMLKMGGSTVEETLRVLLNKCPNEGRIPDAWHNAEVVLLFKKSYNTDIENQSVYYHTYINFLPRLSLTDSPTS